jgi:hypothetical protein
MVLDFVKNWNQDLTLNDLYNQTLKDLKLNYSKLKNVQDIDKLFEVLKHHRIDNNIFNLAYEKKNENTKNAAKI